MPCGRTRSLLKVTDVRIHSSESDGGIGEAVMWSLILVGFGERLMFIRAVRDLQDAGSLREVTLTGIKIVMVTILNACENDHEVCIDAFRSIRTPLVTSWAVLTEAAYLLGYSIDAQEALFGLVERGAVTIAPLVSEDLPSRRKLMRTYTDLPMHLADATLVHLAKKTGTHTAFTLDSRDFSADRTGGRKHPKIIPQYSK